MAAGQGGAAGEPGGRLDEIAALLDGLPPDDPALPRLLAEAMRLLFGNGPNRSALRDDRTAARFEQWAARLPAGHPAAPVALFLGRAARYVQALFAGDTDRADATLTEMLRSADLVPEGHPALPFVYCGVACAYVERHALKGDLRNLDLAMEAINRALATADAIGGEVGPGSQVYGFLQYVRGHIRMSWNVYDLQLPRVTDAIRDLEQAAGQLGPEMVSRLEVGPSLETARIMHEQLTAPSGPGRPLGNETSKAFEALARSASTMGRDQVGYPVIAAQAAAGLAMRALSSGEEAVITQAIAQLAAACATPGLGLRERPRLLELHGFALQTRHHMTRDPRDLSNAISLLEDARRAVEQELGSPYASSVLLSLASAYRTRDNETLGDTERAVRVGLDGLREQAGDVLLQDSDENALHMARRGSDDATEMARWFLARGRHAAAVTAIELGRGMVLHAATAGASVAAALAAAGRAELAEAWARRAGGSPGPDPRAPGSTGEADDDLRYRAMRALEGTPAEAALLSPPAPQDIAAALAQSGPDMLAYLLPQDENGGGMATGMAVLVDRAGTVQWIPLARLRSGKGTPADDFARASSAAAKDQDEDEATLPRWRESLGQVCDWAWGAAIGPLLSAARRGQASGAEARPLRVVLVPAGQLGLIPWHAARRSADGARPRYACQDAIFSYASSARQFVEASRRRPREWARQPVLVGDSNVADLKDAALEIAYLYTAHYQGGAVYGAARDHLTAGVPGAAAASPEVVLAALPHGRSPGASLLHFGCHGQVRVPVLDAELQVGHDAKGERISVSVRDILRQARLMPPESGEDSGGLVILAACLSDVTEADYDEALTLASTFLAAGSTGVVAARWAVTDKLTARFMAAFHLFLAAGNSDAAGALREAQLWMLDPAREVPATWPEWLKRRAPSLAQVEAWAAFTYQGR